MKGCHFFRTLTLFYFFRVVGRSEGEGGKHIAAQKFHNRSVNKIFNISKITEISAIFGENFHV